MTLRRVLPYIAVALAIIVIATMFAAWLYLEIETPYFRAPEKETFVEIPRGMDTGSVAKLLVESGILHHRIPFIVYLRFTGDTGRVQAGEYRFTEPASPKDIAGRLIRGDNFYRVVTIPEGLTAMETIDLLAREGFGERDTFLPALQQTKWISDIDPDVRDLEGFLFPETYHFDRKVDSEQVIKTMVEQFRKRFEHIIAQNPIPEGWTASRIVVLASMIEKEVRKADERSLVSSVFWNRLERKMPLACDATIIYALKLRGAYDGNIRKADLSMESPYNTYTNIGLPPGPIANPGAESLIAALDPADSEYLYYVSRNDGTHVFSKTYIEHQQAVNKYQKNR